MDEGDWHGVCTVPKNAGKEPEYGSPALKLVQRVTDDRTERWADRGAHLSVAYTGASIDGRNNILDERMG